MAEVITGVRAKLRLDGKDIGYAVNVAISSDIEYGAIRTLDDIRVVQHVPLAYSASMSAAKVRLLNNPLDGSLDLFPKTGRTSTEHLINVLNRTPFTAIIEDARGTIIATVEDVLVTGVGSMISAGAVVMEDVSFVCRVVKSEAEN